ncbi:hypothetical protein HDU76_002150 [Blyttiomyces sp. JEL0837]|nr:hypothetical protein HDU76_002150 [Blyttiomyces sp. JEL0837]
MLAAAAAINGGPLLSVQPFSAGRFDSSASVAGGPSDPKLLRQHMEPQRMTMRNYQTFVQALGSFRRQILALANASEAFVRALEDLSDYVPGAQIREPHLVGDLDFLIDSTHLIANAHQIWAESLERDFEEPLMRHMNELMNKVKIRQKENKVKIDELVERLHKEEEASYKMAKKKQRDLATLQNSLNVRVSLADEIKRLTVESATMQDILAANSVEPILSNCASGVRSELETYDRIMEGLKKIGAFGPDEGYLDHDNDPTSPNRHLHHPSPRASRGSLYAGVVGSGTDILPMDSISNVIVNPSGTPQLRDGVPGLPTAPSTPLMKGSPGLGGRGGKGMQLQQQHQQQQQDGGYDVEVVRSALKNL